MPKRHYCDFRVYHHAAQRFLAKQELYVQDSPAITPFKYSPFFAFAFSPLGLLPIHAAAGVFFAVNFLATIALFLFARKLTAKQGIPKRRAFLIYLLTAVFMFRYVLLNWDSGQAVILMLCLVAMSLYFFSEGKDVPGAALLACAILIKYTPAIVIPYLVARRKFKAAAWTALFLAALLILPAVCVGFRQEMRYLFAWFPSIISTSLDQGSYFDFMNQSIFSMVLRLAADSPYKGNLLSLDFHSALMLAYAVSCVLYLLALVPKKGKDTRAIDYALLFVCIPLFNPNGWVLSFVALVYPCFVLIHHLFKVKFKDTFTLALLLMAAFIMVFWGRSLVGEDLQFVAEVSSFTTLGALLIMACLAKLKFDKHPVF